MKSTNRGQRRLIVIALLLGGAVALLMLKPPTGSGTPPMVPVDSLPAITSASDVETLNDSTVFDLRQWAARDTAGTHVRMYNRTRYLKHRRTDSLVVHYATEGKRITFTCPGRWECGSRMQRVKDPLGERNYAVVHDITDVAIGAEFEVIVEADYVNGFRNSRGDAAATYTSEGADPNDRITLTLLFPEDKPVGNFRPATDPSMNLTRRPEVTPDRERIFWQVQPVRPNTHYIIHWTW